MSWGESPASQRKEDTLKTRHTPEAVLSLELCRLAFCKAAKIK